MNSKYYRYFSLALLGLSLGLVGCSKDELQKGPVQSSESQSDKLVDPLADLDLPRLSLNLEAELVSQSEARSLDYKVVPRGDRRTDGKEYPNEFSTQLNLKVGDKISVYTVIYRNGATVGRAKKPIVIRKWLPFEVISAENSSRNNNKKNVIRYVGDITLPDIYKDYTFEEDFKNGATDDWHIMGIINYTASRVLGDHTGGFTNHGRKNDENKGSDEETDEWNRLSQGSSVANASVDGYGNIGGSPYVAKWKPLTLSKGSRGEGSDKREAYIGGQFELEFKPQGVLIQVELGGNTSQGFDIRRYGMVSNVLDFSGMYSLSDADVVSSFQNNELPRWVADEPKTFGFAMHYLPEAGSPISSGARFYPWDQPSLENSGQRTWDKSKYSTAKELSLPSGTVRETRLLGRKLASTSYTTNYIQGNSLLTSTMTFGTPWQFRPIGNGYNSSIVTIWAMPRDNNKVVGNPYTYFWISAYPQGIASKEDIFDNSFTPQDALVTKYNDLIRLRNQLSNEFDEPIKDLKYLISVAKDDGNKASLEARLKQLESQRDAKIASTGFAQKQAQFAQDSTAYYGTLQPAFLNQVSVRTQPFLVLYQSKQKFDQRKGTIVHVQTLLETDLMFSEVTYKKDSEGRNLSFVSIRNMSRSPRDLKNYAIARLIPNGDHLSYRKPDGTATEDLNEAQILPLSIANMAYSRSRIADPFSQSGSPFASWTSRGHYDNPTTRFYGETPKKVSYYDTTEGEYHNNSSSTATYYFTDLRNELLLWDRGIVLGASGYASKRDYPDGWSIMNNIMNDYRQRVAAFASFADGAAKSGGGYEEGTLDYNPGDAFVLLKSNGSGGWQIIDATGPIGREELGFAGSYADYKTQFDALAGSSAFSMQRIDGVSFPFLAPFRTKRMTTNWSDDWTLITDEDKIQKGYTSPHRPNVYDRYLKRTPLDKSYSTYRDNIPDYQYK